MRMVLKALLNIESVAQNWLKKIYNGQRYMATNGFVKYIVSSVCSSVHIQIGHVNKLTCCMTYMLLRANLAFSWHCL